MLSPLLAVTLLIIVVAKPKPNNPQSLGFWPRVAGASVPYLLHQQSGPAAHPCSIHTEHRPQGGGYSSERDFTLSGSAL
jgi:hypothetical protein